MIERLRKIHFFILICIAITLPFSINHVQINSFFILIGTVNAFVLAIFSKEYKQKQKWGIFLLLILLFLLHLVGLIKTDNFSFAAFELQKKLSILLFPMIFVFTPKLNVYQIKTILLSFAAACVLVGVLCLLRAIYAFVVDNNTAFFFYQKFSGTVRMHAVYLSLHFCFALAILIYYLIIEKISVKSFTGKWFVVSIVIISVSVFLLSARVQIFLLVAGGGIAYVVFIKNAKTKLLPTISLLILIISVASFLYFTPALQDRFKEAINYKNQYPIDKQWGGRALRELKWSCAAEVIRENFFTGVGTGDVQDELDLCYKKRNYVPLLYWKDTRYNSHNQYLDTFIEFGIAGILTLVLCFVVAARIAIKNKNLLYIAFILLFAISCLTESFLERQHGIVFYAFFNSLFVFHSLSENSH